MTDKDFWLDENDFTRLSDASMQWAGTDWQEQDGRFATVNRGEFVRWDLAYAFWFDSLPSLMLAREFLRAKGVEFQELYDEAEPHCGGCHREIQHEPYMLITNYETESWKTRREGLPCPHHH